MDILALLKPEHIKVIECPWTSETTHVRLEIPGLDYEKIINAMIGDNLDWSKPNTGERILSDRYWLCDGETDLWVNLEPKSPDDPYVYANAYDNSGQGGDALSCCIGFGFSPRHDDPEEDLDGTQDYLRFTPDLSLRDRLMVAHAIRHVAEALKSIH